MTDSRRQPRDYGPVLARMLGEIRRSGVASQERMERLSKASDARFERAFALFADEEQSVTAVLVKQGEALGALQGVLKSQQRLLQRILGGQAEQTEVLHEICDDLHGQRGTMEAMGETLGAMRDDLHAQAKVLERIARGLGSARNGKNGGNPSAGSGQGGRRKR